MFWLVVAPAGNRHVRDHELTIALTAGWSAWPSLRLLGNALLKQVEHVTDGYSTWFERTAGFAPHPWQAELGAQSKLEDRLLRIPTGFGKTAGVVLAWLFNAVERNDPAWPRRLVFTLPMRVLVEQTERAIAAWLQQTGAAQSVGLHVLMGGSDAGEWALSPERPAILVGTQDMMLSRALNRGYAAPRARWPVDFGLLQHDALWVLDEIQLMDVGLATSAQLGAFKAADAASVRGALRPTATWWMSATLQPDWLATVDVAERVPELSAGMLRIPSPMRTGGLWEVKKQLSRRADMTTPGEMAASVLEQHQPGTLTLIVVNRVDTASAVCDELDKRVSEGKGKKRVRRVDAPDVRLVHSRFRGAERAAWANDFLRRDAPLPDAGRIVVATQVVEAGVDISARLLVSEIAPWPSLAQRFGRAARYEGDAGEVCVVGALPKDEGKALPYALGELEAAEEALSRLLAGDGDVSPRGLEAFEDGLRADAGGAALIERLYPYDPVHVLRRRDLDELFDTAPDLSGSDSDVGRYIRSGEERDISVFWRPIEESARSMRVRDIGPVKREELCPAPIGEARKWLADDPSTFSTTLRVLGLVATRVSSIQGFACWCPQRSAGTRRSVAGTPRQLAVLSLRPPLPTSRTKSLDLPPVSGERGGRQLSIAGWKTIATHGREAGEDQPNRPGSRTGRAAWAATELAARWHDAGKAHEVFQDAIKDEARQNAQQVGARRESPRRPMAHGVAPLIQASGFSPRAGQHPRTLRATPSVRPDASGAHGSPSGADARDGRGAAGAGRRAARARGPSACRRDSQPCSRTSSTWSRSWCVRTTVK